MSEAEVVEEVPVTEETVAEVAPVVEEEAPVVVAETVVVEPKKKRKRSPAQIKWLENARKAKATKKRKVLKNPLKIEKKYATETEEPSFSWSKEVAKAALLASLGLASVYVQQTFAQEKKQPVVETQTTTTKDNTAAAPPMQKKKVSQSSKDPFSGYR